MALTINQTEAAKIIGVSRGTVARLEEEGKLRRLKDLPGTQYNLTQVLSLSGEGKATYMERKLTEENRRLQEDLERLRTEREQLRRILG